jgi:hypothetical protein
MTKTTNLTAIPATVANILIYAASLVDASELLHTSAYRNRQNTLIEDAICDYAEEQGDEDLYRDHNDLAAQVQLTIVNLLDTYGVPTHAQLNQLASLIEAAHNLNTGLRSPEFAELDMIAPGEDIKITLGDTRSNTDVTVQLTWLRHGGFAQLERIRETVSEVLDECACGEYTLAVIAGSLIAK